MPTLTPPGRKQKEVGGKFLVASALILTLEAHCLVGIGVDPSEDFLLGPPRAVSASLKLSDLTQHISMAATPSSFCFPEVHSTQNLLLRAPLCFREFSWAGLKLAPYLVPRIHVYLTLCQKGVQLLPRCSSVTSDSLVSQLLPWNSCPVSHTQSNDYLLPRNKHQMLQWKEGSTAYTFSPRLDMTHNRVLALSKEISLVNPISTFYTLKMDKRVQELQSWSLVISFKPLHVCLVSPFGISYLLYLGTPAETSN